MRSLLTTQILVGLVLVGSSCSRDEKRDEPVKAPRAESSPATRAATRGEAREDTIDSVEQKLIAAWRKHKTITAEVKVELNVDNVSGKVTSTYVARYEYMTKNGKTLVRQEGKTTGVAEQPGQEPRKINESATMIADGQYIYTINDQYGGMSKAFKMDQGLTQDTMGGPGFFTNLQERFSLRRLPDSEVQGEAVYVIEAVPKPFGSEEVRQSLDLDFKIVFYMSKATGFSIHAVQSSNDGKSVSTMTATKFTFDRDIPEEHFVFHGDKDQEVVDMTSEARARMDEWAKRQSEKADATPEYLKAPDDQEAMPAEETVPAEESEKEKE